MNHSIRIPVPLLLAIIVAAVALFFALGARSTVAVSSGGVEAKGWAIATAPSGVYVLNQDSGNLYFLADPPTSIGNKGKLKLLTNIRTAH